MAAYTGTLVISGLPAGNVTLTVTASDALGESTSATRTVDHVIPGPPPPPPPSFCTALDGGSANLTVVNAVTGTTILDYDASSVVGYLRSTREGT